MDAVVLAAGEGTRLRPRTESRPKGLVAVASPVEKPADPPSTLVQSGFFVFSPAVFHACHLVRPSDRGE